MALSTALPVRVVLEWFLKPLTGPTPITLTHCGQLRLQEVLVGKCERPTSVMAMPVVSGSEAFLKSLVA